MTRRRLAIFPLVAALAVPAQLSAQVPGMPVRTAGWPRGFSVAADVGVPNEASGLGRSYGATAGVGLGRLGLTGMAARADLPDQDAVIALGLTAGVRLVGGPLVPFSATLQAGVGRWNNASTQNNVVYDLTVTTYTAGLGLAWTIASPIVSVKPWLAPRMHWSRQGDDYGSGGTTASDPALSAGIDLGFINGLTLRGMYDRVLNDGIDATAWSVGMGYSFRMGR